MNATRKVFAPSFLRRAVATSGHTTGSSSRQTSAGTTKRFFGAGHQPEPQSMKAQLWEGHPKYEGFERITEVTYGVAAVLIALALGFAPNTSIKTVSF